MSCLPRTRNSNASLEVYFSWSAITKQFISPLSDIFNSLIVTNWKCTDSKEHPLQLQLNLLSDGGVGVTIHVKVRLDPAVSSRKLVFLWTGGAENTLTLYLGTAKQIHVEAT